MGDLGSPTSSINHSFRTRPPQNQQTTVTKFDIVSFPFRRGDEVVEAMSSLSRRITTSLYSILTADSHQLYVNTPAPAPMSTTLFTQGHSGDVRIALLPTKTYERSSRFHVDKKRKGEWKLWVDVCKFGQQQDIHGHLSRFRLVSDLAVIRPDNEPRLTE